MSLLTPLTRSIELNTGGLNYTPSAENERSKLDNDVRKTYFNTLNAMKIAHFKTYFEMRDAAIETNEGIPLCRLFKSFQPCPFKLIMIESFKKPLDLLNLPEIFQGFEADFANLYRAYQKLNGQSQKELLEGIIEDADLDSIEFNDALDSFLEKVEEGPHSVRISLLLRTFKADVSEAKDLMDFHLEINKHIRNLHKDPMAQVLPIDILLMRTLSSIMILNEVNSINNRYISRLGKLNAQYNSLSAYSQYLLNQEFQLGRFGLSHGSVAEEILTELEKIIREIKLKRVADFQIFDA